MKRIITSVPPPMREQIDEFQERNGYENRSQAIRAILRRGLDE